MQLVGDNCFQFFSLFYNLGEFSLRRYAIAEVFLVVDLSYLSVKVGRNAMFEFFHGVNTCSFEELGKLTGNAVDAEQVGLVGPFKL